MPANRQTSSPQEALKAAVEHLGSQAAMARLLDVSQPSVWKWLHKGAPLPSEHVLKVEAETGISRHDLRPDIYPVEIVAELQAQIVAGLGGLEPVR